MQEEFLLKKLLFQFFLRARHSLPVNAYACCALLRSVMLCSTRSTVYQWAPK